MYIMVVAYCYVYLLAHEQLGKIVDLVITGGWLLLIKTNTITHSLSIILTDDNFICREAFDVHLYS